MIDAVWYALGYFFLMVGEWLLLQHFWEQVAKPYIQDLAAQIENKVISQHSWQHEWYHENKLLPAVTLLASRQVPCEPPAIEVEKEKEPTPFKRPQLSADQIEDIWSKVKATY